jgi:hypothetical protein
MLEHPIIANGAAKIKQIRTELTHTLNVYGSAITPTIGSKAESIYESPET